MQFLFYCNRYSLLIFEAIVSHICTFLPIFKVSFPNLTNCVLIIKKRVFLVQRKEDWKLGAKFFCQSSNVYCHVTTQLFDLLFCSFPLNLLLGFSSFTTSFYITEGFFGWCRTQRILKHWLTWLCAAFILGSRRPVILGNQSYQPFCFLFFLHKNHFYQRKSVDYNGYVNYWKLKHNAMKDLFKKEHSVKLLINYHIMCILLDSYVEVRCSFYMEVQVPIFFLLLF